MKESFKKFFCSDIKGIPHENQWSAFLLPVFLLGAVFFSMKVHPLGNTSLFTCDLFHQYAPILAELRSKIVSGESLFYTWNMGMGTNFWAIISYYGASPLNLILIFFPEAYLSDAVTLMILIRTGLSGLFFSLLLKRKDGTEGTPALALSTAYALCGYVLAYFWNLMWMDAVVLLPLVVLGLWKLFSGDRPRLYVISLFLVIFSNFYTGFFVCLFLVLFAPALYMEARSNNTFVLRPVAAGLRFVGYSILSAGMTAVLLLPAILALKSTSASIDTVIWTPDLSYTLFDFLSQFLVHADPVIREGLPNVYSSVVILLLVPLYALCRTIPVTQRVLNMGLAFFLYLSMNSPVLDFFWNGMHYTNQIPYRQAFLLCFLLLYIGSQVLLHLDGISKKMVFYAGLAVLIYLVILDQAGEAQKNYWMIYGSAVLVVIYSIVLSGFFASGKEEKIARKAFLYVLIFEMFLAAEFAMSYIESTEHFAYLPAYGQYSDQLADDISESDGSLFTRTVMLPSATKNDGALYQYKTLSIFASTTPQSYIQFMSSMGFSNNQVFDVQAEGLTEVTQRLFGIRNIVKFTAPESDEAFTEGFTESHSNILSANKDGETGGAGETNEPYQIYTGYDLSVDENALPLGFYIPAEGTLTVLDRILSPFSQTNTLFESMGTQAVYDSGEIAFISSNNVSVSPDINSYTILESGQFASLSVTPTVQSGNEDVLLYVGTKQETTVRITRISSTTGESSVTELDSLPGQIIDCGKSPFSEESEMTVQIVFTSPLSETFSIYCGAVNEASLDTASAILGAEPLTVTSFDSTHMKGTVAFSKDGSLLTTIPYDAGWTVKIDGQTVRTQAAYGALLSVQVTKGTHDISFSYQTPGFMTGLLISLILTADFVLLSFWNPFEFISKKMIKRRESALTDEKEERQ